MVARLRCSTRCPPTRSTPAAAPAAPTTGNYRSRHRRASSSTPTSTPCGCVPVTPSASTGNGAATGLDRPHARRARSAWAASAPTPPRSTRRPRRSPAAATRPSPTSPRRPAGTPSQVSGATGAYDVTVEGYRPGTQGDRGRRQTVLLDFAPGRVNTGTWGGPGVATSRRSPRSSRSGASRAPTPARSRTASSTWCARNIQTELGGHSTRRSTSTCSTPGPTPS